MQLAYPASGNLQSYTGEYKDIQFLSCFLFLEKIEIFTFPILVPGNRMISKQNINLQCYKGTRFQTPETSFVISTRFGNEETRSGSFPTHTQNRKRVETQGYNVSSKSGNKHGFPPSNDPEFDVCYPLNYSMCFPSNTFGPLKFHRCVRHSGGHLAVFLICIRSCKPHFFFVASRAEVTS